MSDMSRRSSVFERNPDSKGIDEAIQNSKSIRKKNHQTQTNRTADRVLRLLSAHISFAVDVR
jgi:hypothetical protein